MLYLHCTNKLVENLRIPISDQKKIYIESFLLDWTATYFWFKDTRVYLFVNNKTLFSFIAKEIILSTLKLDITAGIIDSLHKENISIENITPVISKINDIIFVKNTNRIILGSINQIVYFYQYNLNISEDIDNVNITEIERKVNRVPFKYLSYIYPVDVMKDKLRKEGLYDGK